MQESHSIRVWKCPDGTSSARLCAGTDSSGRRPRVDGPPNATGARLDCDLGDDFADPSVRMGPVARNRRRFASGGHPSFSPHGQHRNARYPGDGSRAGGNGTACGVEGRAEMEPGCGGRYRAGARRLCAVHTSRFFYLSRHFFCWKASIPGRFWDRSAGNCGFGPRSSRAVVCCWQSFSLVREHNLAHQSPSRCHGGAEYTDTIFLPICCISCFLSR